MTTHKIIHVYLYYNVKPKLFYTFVWSHNIAPHKFLIYIFFDKPHKLLIMSNTRDTTYFITICLQTDIALMWQYTISAIKTSNWSVRINLIKSLNINLIKSLKRKINHEIELLNPVPPQKTIWTENFRCPSFGLQFWQIAYCLHKP